MSRFERLRCFTPPLQLMQLHVVSVVMDAWDYRMLMSRMGVQVAMFTCSNGIQCHFGGLDDNNAVQDPVDPILHRTCLDGHP